LRFSVSYCAPWRHLGQQFNVAAPDLASLRADGAPIPLNYAMITANRNHNHINDLEKRPRKAPGKYEASLPALLAAKSGEPLNPAERSGGIAAERRAPWDAASNLSVDLLFSSLSALE
jgi:hypothetical protein